MYVHSLSIENLRCFSKANLSLQYPGREEGSPVHPNINLLLGNNGSGKTTVLKSIALAVLSQVIESSGYVPYYLVRRGSNPATVTADLIFHQHDVSQTNSPMGLIKNAASTTIESVGDYERLKTMPSSEGYWLRIFEDDSPAFIVLGYGATRRVESSDFSPSTSRKSRRLRYQRVAGLFEDHIALTPMEFWWPKVKEIPNRYDEIYTLFGKVLPADIRLEKNSDDEILFEHRGVKVPFSALSDGYRSYIGWLGDLVYHLHTICPLNLKISDLNGVVLIDEIDLHIHPEWQREIISMISNAFPNIQFVLTSHSPIVAGTLDAKNLFILELEPDGLASNIHQYKEQVYGLNADQVLLSSYFNLNTTRAPGFVNELREITRRAQKGDPDAGLEFLKRLTHGGREKDSENE